MLICRSAVIDLHYIFHSNLAQNRLRTILFVINIHKCLQSNQEFNKIMFLYHFVRRNQFFFLHKLSVAHFQCFPFQYYIVVNIFCAIVKLSSDICQCDVQYSHTELNLKHFTLTNVSFGQRTNTLTNSISILNK